MSLSFKNKVALLTGAASGMGLAAAKAFAQAGASITMADINEDAARAAADELNVSGSKAIGVRFNVFPALKDEASLARNW